MSFKKGDVVRCNRGSYDHKIVAGVEYTVGAEEQVGDDVYIVGSGWWFASRFSLVKHETPQKEATVLGTQVGGTHYTDCAIQPITYIWANGLGFSEGNIIKYVTRWRSKGGVKDLEKAKHHIALLIDHTLAEEAKGNTNAK